MLIFINDQIKNKKHKAYFILLVLKYIPLLTPVCAMGRFAAYDSTILDLLCIEVEGNFEETFGINKSTIYVSKNSFLVLGGFYLLLDHFLNVVSQNKCSCGVILIHSFVSFFFSIFRGNDIIL